MSRTGWAAYAARGLSSDAWQVCADAGLLLAAAFHVARCSPGSAAVAGAALLAHRAAGAHPLRWQLWPALAAAAAAAAAAAVAAPASAPWWAAAGARAAGALLVSASAALALLLFPQRRVPPPSGPYRVGLRVVHLEGPGGEGFNLRVYYPADSDAPQRRAPYLRHGLESARAFAHFARVPAFAMDHMALLRVPLAAEGAPLARASAPFPAVAFSHGLGGTACCYQGVVADLASNGLVVLAVEHNDLSAAMTKLRCGTVRQYRWLADLRRTAADGATPLPAGAADRTEFEVRAAQLAHRAAEVRAALDWAASDEAADEMLWRGRVGLERFGAAGHSFGAATACAAAAADARVAAVVALDTWMFPLGDAPAPPAAAPVLLLQGEGFRRWRDNHEAMAAYHARAAPGSRFGTLQGARHQTFSDFVCLMPVATRLARQAGAADPDAALTLIANAAGGFLAARLGAGPALPARRHSRLAAGAEPPPHGLVVDWEGEEKP